MQLLYGRNEYSECVKDVDLLVLNKNDKDYEPSFAEIDWTSLPYALREFAVNFGNWVYDLEFNFSDDTFYDKNENDFKWIMSVDDPAEVEKPTHILRLYYENDPIVELQVFLTTKELNCILH